MSYFHSTFLRYCKQYLNMNSIKVYTVGSIQKEKTPAFLLEVNWQFPVGLYRTPVLLCTQLVSCTFYSVFLFNVSPTYFHIVSHRPISSSFYCPITSHFMDLLPFILPIPVTRLFVNIQVFILQIMLHRIALSAWHFCRPACLELRK